MPTCASLSEKRARYEIESPILNIEIPPSTTAVSLDAEEQKDIYIFKPSHNDFFITDVR